jgi:hypothetical protein
VCAEIEVETVVGRSEFLVLRNRHVVAQQVKRALRVASFFLTGISSIPSLFDSRLLSTSGNS